MQLEYRKDYETLMWHIYTGKNNQFPFWELYRVFGEFPRKSQICESETIPRLATWEFTIPNIGKFSNIGNSTV